MNLVIKINYNRILIKSSWINNSNIIYKLFILKKYLRFI